MKPQKYSLLCIEEEAMAGHVMEPLESLSSELPNGSIVLGHDKAVSALQEEISTLRSRYRYLDRRRREAMDKLIDLKGSIRVFCRVRPLHLISNYMVKSSVSIKQDMVTVRSVGMKKEFSFDRLFDQESTQDDVFQEVKPILKLALDGHNVCILAYGQTGTGKTYTMEGTNGKLGIVPRAIQELFSHASQDNPSTYAFSMSMLEAYMGNLRDLLAPKQPPSNPMDCNKKCNLSILATSNGAVEVEGLTDVPIRDTKEANQWYCRGRRARSTSWTNVNGASSRSHCLTRITIRRCSLTEQVSKIWLVDLGGSERLLKTGATGLTMDEGKAINLSLSALGDVIAALRQKRSHVPYRTSKLTQVLSDSLGDGSKVLMIVHISPSEHDVSETISSLRFTKRARMTEFSREFSEESKMQKQKRMTELDKEVCDTEEEIKKVSEQIIRAENLIQEKKHPRSTLVADQIEDTAGIPQATKKAKFRADHCSVPHFMSSTACSRRWQSEARKFVDKMRLTASVNRRRSGLTGDQSLSYSSCKNAKAQSVLKDLSVRTDQINMGHNSIGLTAASACRRASFGSRLVARAPLHQYRRMSNLT